MSAWAGGDRGRVVMDRVIDRLDDYVAPGGVMYLVAVLDNRPEELCAEARARGWACEVVLVRSADEEKLHILRYQRPPLRR